MDKRRFLERFEPRQRCNVDSTFLSKVRDGITEPQAIVAGVCRELLGKMISARRYGNERIIERNREYLEIIDSYPDEVLDYALWAVEWEQLTDAEKQSIKRGRGEHYRREYMSQQPASEKQINYLRHLGWTGEVKSKLHAA